MSVKATVTELPGVIIIEPRVFRDARGFFWETFHGEKYARLGINKTFVQDNHSHSAKGILRGLHYQLKHPQGKLIYVVRGEIFDVAVDIRRGSPTFGRWTGEIISSENKRQIYVPEGFAHGFYVLSKEADVIYKCTDLYASGDEYGILWSDPAININWPIAGDPLLSEKDSQYPLLNDLPEEHLPLYDDHDTVS
jgi:dTDP-4-dehydrorhamnose 3,5-epimerase